MHIDIEALKSLVDEHYLTCRHHPTLPLRIYNYTFKTQVTGHWTPETRMCRGLITTHDGEVVARPFPKFFNLGEREDEVLPDEPFTVTTKEDGSLLIVTSYQGELVVATRGSFISEQAVRGKKIIQEKYSDFRYFFKDSTYLFEVVFPENRIVVDYGDREDIILLALIHTESSQEFDIWDEAGKSWPFPVVKRYDGVRDIEELLAMEQENQEGFVLRFESGLRIKCKFSEYVRIHRIITQTTARHIWEYLKEGKSLKVLLERVPPEFEAWVKRQSKELSDRYRQLHQQSKDIYKATLDKYETTIPNSLAFHMSVSQFLVERLANEIRNRVKERFEEYPEIAPFLLMLYARKKKKEVSNAIWDSLYPPPMRPFRIDEEAV